MAGQFRKRGVFVFLIATFIALIPQYIMRSSYRTYFWLYKKFSTYPGDLWYCWDHYLKKGFPYPREYPAGIQAIFQIIYRLKLPSYEVYIVVISLFLSIFAIITTYFLYILVQDSHKNTKRLWTYWIFAPSFLFYALLNLDLISIFTIVVSYYLFLEEEYYLSASMLALGTTMKVFPIFLTPLFFFQAPKKVRFGSVLAFILSWFAFNIPSMIYDWKGWIFPYWWQINCNFAKSPTDGTYWWILYKLFDNINPNLQKWVGRLSLLMYGTFYFLFLRKKELPLPRKALGVIILFLLTDRIYSPQYNLYMLPFMALVDYDVKKSYFYTAEIINVAQVLFLFFWKENPHYFKGLYLQIMIFIKYIMLILIFMQNYKEPIQINTPKLLPHTSMPKHKMITKSS